LKTSLIIPSYNPEIKLPLTLKALIGQAKWIDELIIVADKKNSMEEVKSILQPYSGSFNLKIISNEISGRGRSRNKGAAASTGDLLVFLDDDMLVVNNLIGKHIQYHIDKHGIIVSGNGYRNPEDANYDFGKFLINMEKSWKSGFDGIVEVTLNKFNFTASNMSLSKNIFQQLGGFDTRFSDGEDFDLGVRALNKGIRVIYDINLLAWHNDWPKLNIYINRQNEYSLAKMEIAKVHPEYLQYFPNLKFRKSSRIKKFVSFISRKTLGKWIISGYSFFDIFPINVKFLFYRIAIFSFSSNNR
jgi:GT2 family glycosyltransferase